MSRKKDTVKGGATLARIRENSRLMSTHESMVDFLNGRHSGGSILEVFASGLLGLDFLRTFDSELEDDIIYSDDDYNDDDDNEDDNHFYTRNASYRPLEPHPRIKQLTDEEADKHARELIEEEERRKDKTERNKRKKLRKKEKKRLQKENAVKDIIPEEENGKSESDSSEIQEENPVIESIAEANDSPEAVKTQSGTEAAGCDENSANNKEDTPVIESIAEANDSPEAGKTQSGTEAAGCDENSANNKEDTPGRINTTEDGEKKDLDLNNSYTSTTKLVAEEVCNERPARERKKKKTKLLEVLQSKEEKPKVVEEPEVQKQEEEKHEPDKEKIMDPASEVLAKRSREFAGIGNQFAASGQYEMAVKCFTDAIKYNPKEFKLFGNRSLCYERIQQYENALGDADLALSMEPNWIKGLFRKGKALCGLKRYYEASLIYKEVLKLEGSSAEAMLELKRAQTLHLMEMGFTWAQSSEALKTHATLEQAVEALFDDDRTPGPGDAGASCDNTDQPVVQEENYDAGEWTVLQTSRPRMQQVKEFGAFVQSRSNSQSPTPRSRNSGKPDVLSVWVGSLAPAVTYSTLHELFSRAGTVHSIKMLLEQQCAFVNYTRKEDCDRAIQCINGMVVEGAPLLVRHPCKFHTGLGVSSLYKKECFFWRTTGCTRQDCTFRHVPEHKNLDKDKFTSRLGGINL